MIKVILWDFSKVPVADFFDFIDLFGLFRKYGFLLSTSVRELSQISQKSRRPAPVEISVYE